MQHYWVDIDYSADGGKTWVSVVKAVENKNSVSWTVPGVITDSCKLRLRASEDSVITCESQGLFSIRQKPAVTLIKPRGGELYSDGKLLSVAWETIGKVDSLRIIMSIDSGRTWSELVRSTPNDGGYVFPVAIGAGSSNALIKIFDYCDSTIFDECDSVFKILRTNTITSKVGKAAGPVVNLRSTGRGRSAALSVTLPRPEAVSVSVYSLSGKVVFQYRATRLSSGNHSIPMNLNESMSLGIIKAEIGEMQLVKKCFFSN